MNDLIPNFLKYQKQRLIRYTFNTLSQLNLKQSIKL